MNRLVWNYSLMALVSASVLSCRQTTFRTGSSPNIPTSISAYYDDDSLQSPLEKDGAGPYYDKDGNIIDVKNIPKVTIYDKDGNVINPKYIQNYKGEIYDKDGNKIDINNIPNEEIFDKYGNKVVLGGGSDEQEGTSGLGSKIGGGFDENGSRILGGSKFGSGTDAQIAEAFGKTVKTGWGSETFYDKHGFPIDIENPPKVEIFNEDGNKIEYKDLKKHKGDVFDSEGNKLNKDRIPNDEIFDSKKRKVLIGGALGTEGLVDSSGRILDVSKPPYGEIFNEEGKLIDPEEAKKYSGKIFDSQGNLLEKERLPISEIFDDKGHRILVGGGVGGNGLFDYFGNPVNPKGPLKVEAWAEDGKQLDTKTLKTHQGNIYDEQGNLITNKQRIPIDEVFDDGGWKVYTGQDVDRTTGQTSSQKPLGGGATGDSPDSTSNYSQKGGTTGGGGIFDILKDIFSGKGSGSPTGGSSTSSNRPPNDEVFKDPHGGGGSGGGSGISTSSGQTSGPKGGTGGGGGSGISTPSGQTSSPKGGTGGGGGSGISTPLNQSSSPRPPRSEPFIDPNKGDGGGNDGGYVLKKDEVWLELIVVRQNHEAWWKNCISVWVTSTDYIRDIGCNKDPGTPTRYKLPVKKDKCNNIEIIMNTHVNKEGVCEANFKKTGSTVCNGPYDSKPDMMKPTFEPSTPMFAGNVKVTRQREGFLIFSSKDLKRALSSQAYKYLLFKLDKEPQAYGNPLSLVPEGNKHMRVFIEDQPMMRNGKAHLSAALSPQKLSPTDMQTRGIDYNDYVLDFISYGNIPVQFQIGGGSSNPYSGSVAPEYRVNTCSTK